MARNPLVMPTAPMAAKPPTPASAFDGRLSVELETPPFAATLAPGMKLASLLARKAIRDALSSGSQTFLGDGGCYFGHAVQGFFVFALSGSIPSSIRFHTRGTGRNPPRT